MAQLNHKTRKYGIAWLLISPVLLLMAAISTVESYYVYVIQLIIFSLIATAGCIGGVFLLFLRPFARAVLEYLSWLVFAYFFLAGISMVVEYFVVSKGTLSGLDSVTGVAFLVVLSGIPFLFIAEGLRKYKPE